MKYLIQNDSNFKSFKHTLTDQQIKDLMSDKALYFIHTYMEEQENPELFVLHNKTDISDELKKINQIKLNLSALNYLADKIYNDFSDADKADNMIIKQLIHDLYFDLKFKLNTIKIKYETQNKKIHKQGKIAMIIWASIASLCIIMAVTKKITDADKNNSDKNTKKIEKDIKKFKNARDAIPYMNITSYKNNETSK